MSELTTAGRKHIAHSNFAIPGKAPASGSYPIHDIAHARNALARSSGKAVAGRVRAAVYRKYPGLRKRAKKSKNFEALRKMAKD
jgi:hypothetical protein